MKGRGSGFRVGATEMYTIRNLRGVGTGIKGSGVPGLGV